MKKTLLAATALVASSAAAFAGGPSQPVVEPVITPVAQPAPQLAFGDWQGGYVGANLRWGVAKPAGIGPRPDGFGGAIRGGYDWQMNRAVFGLGAEYDFGKTDNGAGFEVGNTGTIFARAGYNAGAFLPYASVGYSRTDLTSGAVNTKANGYTLAAGAEYRFDQAWSGYAEYSYSRFNDVTALGGIDVSAHKIKAGVNFRF